MNEVKLEKLLKKIESPDTSQKGLINLYNNVCRSDSVSDEIRERIISAIEIATRLRFPRAANKKFGAKDNEAREILERINKTISAELDLSQNRVKNGVKTGGRMINGERFIEVYLSYKNDKKIGAFLEISQISPDSELLATAGLYQTGKNKDIQEDRFEMDLSSEADLLDEYRKRVQEVLES